jgi:hypothetical protein
MAFGNAFNGGVAGSGGRDTLTADRTYYVRTDGNDANTGLVDSSGGAFLTWSYAINFVFTLDWSKNNVRIKAGGTGARAWTLTSANRLIIPNSAVGSGKLILEGDTTTPTNVQLNSIQDIAFFTNTCNTNSVDLKGFHFIQNASQNNTIFVKNSGAGITNLSSCNLGRLTTGSANNQSHLFADNGKIEAKTLAITGGGFCHLWMSLAGKIKEVGAITLTGTPAFLVYAFIDNGATSGWYAPSTVYTGSATGKRYDILGGGISLQGGSSTFFPGNAAGTLAASPSSYYLTF